VSFPNIEARISSPGELATVLRQAKQCVARGILRQVKPANAPFALDDLASIPDDGPWPDYVEAYFVDLKGKQYRLTVETYHGAGGSWGPV
jgi:hypothetical protein